jgi:hypothetical protein
MFTWLARRLGLTPAPAETAEREGTLEQRVRELEEHVDWLHGSLRKLRGRVTGGLRGDPQPDESSEGTGSQGNGLRGNPQAIELLKKRGRM